METISFFCGKATLHQLQTGNPVEYLVIMNAEKTEGTKKP